MVDEKQLPGPTVGSEGMTNNNTNSPNNGETSTGSNHTNPFYPTEIKPEDFVLTSDVKLNFLTKPAPVISKEPSEPAPVPVRRHTGAVPKRPIAVANGSADVNHAGTNSSNISNNTKEEQATAVKSPTGTKSFASEISPGGLSNHQKSTSWEGQHPSTSNISRLQLENEQLRLELESFKKKLSTDNVGFCASSDVMGTSGDGWSRVRELEEEMERMREVVASLRMERKKLKSEKLDLLSQMKQLYATLDDKEKELRDFIRNYERRMRENESSLQRLSTEREERERERWSLLRHARDEAERSLSLAAQLAAKDAQIHQLQDNLDDVRLSRGGVAGGSSTSDHESVVSLPTRVGASAPASGTTPTASATAALPSLAAALAALPPGDRGSCSADSGVRGSSDRESGGATSVGGNLSDSTTDGTPTLAIDHHQNQQPALHPRLDMDSVSIASSINQSHVYQAVGTPKECSPSLSPLNSTSFSRSLDTTSLSRSVEQLSSPVETEPRSSSSNSRKTHYSRLTGRGGAWGSISRVFTRSRHRKVSSPISQEEISGVGGESMRSWSPLTEEGYAEKLRLLREAAGVPMERWRAPAVLAWLEIALGMPQYGARCAENIKSGKVLLELSDLELECGLGISHPMHRKKLRLAIEEHRHPSLVRYPCIGQLGHTWVAAEWLPDLGLAQYAESFASNMVDARMLDHLSKKELEKFLGVTRKFHQASIVHGIHLLRMMKYDRQALAVRRNQCDSVDADPLVWTNQRFIKWARNIDLCEYADNLKDSGVHGALVVLEPSFNGDTMATALGIPPAKNIIRRHLAAELETLVLPARYVIFCQMEEYQAEVARAVNNVKHIQRDSFGVLGSNSSSDDVSSSSLRAAVRGRVEDWKAVWRESISRYLGDFLQDKPPDGSSTEKNWSTATLKRMLKGRRRCGAVQPLNRDSLRSPTESIPGSVTSELNFRASTPPVFDEIQRKEKPRRTRSFVDVRTKNSG